MNIVGEYKFIIRKDGDWYIAKGATPDGKGTMITQGKSEREIFEMIADAYQCIYDVEMSRWEYFWHKLLRLQ